MKSITNFKINSSSWTIKTTKLRSWPLFCFYWWLWTLSLLSVRSPKTPLQNTCINVEINISRNHAWQKKTKYVKLFTLLKSLKKYDLLILRSHIPESHSTIFKSIKHIYNVKYWNLKFKRCHSTVYTIKIKLIHICYKTEEPLNLALNFSIK